MPKPPPFKKRKGSNLPAGRNYQGNRFAGLETEAEEKKEGNPFAKAKKVAAKGKKPKARPGLPKQAMGLAAMMAAAGKK